RVAHGQEQRAEQAVEEGHEAADDILEQSQKIEVHRAAPQLPEASLAGPGAGVSTDKWIAASPLAPRNDGSLLLRAFVPSRETPYLSTTAAGRRHTSAPAPRRPAPRRRPIRSPARCAACGRSGPRRGRCSTM